MPGLRVEHLDVDRFHLTCKRIGKQHVTVIYYPEHIFIGTFRKVLRDASAQRQCRYK